MDDLDVCFIGGSFVAGVGDPEHLAWAGRLGARSSRAGCPLTAYSLGVRRQTSRDVSHRWLLECQQRLPETADGRVVVFLRRQRHD
jgi:acyl-CoA thioesterase-1